MAVASRSLSIVFGTYRPQLIPASCQRCKAVVIGWKHRANDDECSTRAHLELCVCFLDYFGRHHSNDSPGVPNLGNECPRWWYNDERSHTVP